MVLEIKYLNYKDVIDEPNQVICLGFFDGMHKAHIKLIQEARKVAEEKGLPLAVFTFSMSIKTYLIKEHHHCLTTIEDKAEICKQYGVKYLYVMKVEDNLVKMPAKEFINKFLIKSDTVVCGFDFNFGYMGKGNQELLKTYKEFNTLVIEEMKYLDMKIGATRIRANLIEGNLDLVEKLLGRKYAIKGKVIPGRKVGRQLGFPTANIDYLPYNLPKSGVYYTLAFLNGVKYHSLTNIGIRPTYTNLGITVETYLLDFDKQIYGENIKIEFIEYIRPEKKFSNEKELSKQIMNDIHFVKDKI
ncbi:bifunctional riboflavin kinase/FAD synthetase [Candidatus Izemoplasma sp. B36]|uniref:bifunctional riboflavin kinase/FAD synthetase n=1 Tax=Candidatus Izemoplasma sp. B36 TaxID=3242468 RepID=UPI00355909C5